MTNCLVIDTRSPEAFAGGHIPASVNIWLEGLSRFTGWIATPHTRIALVLANPADLDKAVLALSRIGLDDISAVLAHGFESWRSSGFPIARIATTVATEAYATRLVRNVTLLDVRDEREWNEGHIPGAQRIYVGELANKPPELDRHIPIITYCSSGQRSGLAASLLLRHGFQNVSNMLGGIRGWQKLNLPLERPESRSTLAPILEPA